MNSPLPSGPKHNWEALLRPGPPTAPIQSMIPSNAMAKQQKKWDAFISYAIEDQASFVRDLAAMLSRLGLAIWYAETALQIGDSLTDSINRGLAGSRYGIAVVSRNFISKPWPKWELAGLVNRQNHEEQNVILPIWHGVTKDDVLNFSPPLADLWALNTETDQAEEIALKLLRRIDPDLYAKHPRAQLEKLASGEAMRELQTQIDQVRQELEAAEEDLAEYRCPYCGAPLSSRNEAPLDDTERDWDTVQHFACGYSEFGGQVQTPCPSDPKFPRFEDYDLQFRERKTDPLWKWRCIASGKTPMARLLSLTQGLGRTQTEAEKRVRESYDNHVKWGRKPLK